MTETRIPFFRMNGTVSTDPVKSWVYPPQRRVEWRYWPLPVDAIYDWRAERDRVERSAAMGRTT